MASLIHTVLFHVDASGESREGYWLHGGLSNRPWHIN